MKIEGLGTGEVQPETGGGGSTSIPRTMTESGPVLPADSILFVDASGGDVTVTLLPASTHVSITIIRTDGSSNRVIVASEAGDTIQDGTEFPLDSQWSHVTMRSDRVITWIAT